ncbi:TonB-dependent receptor [Lacinutrix sp. WUR7]|uniref:TonB-dependent receptor n=1 Tax=Lacinutrix sp. WUR7 TaxID=2653681 RepID=UPI001EF0D742|nr:TonB-dependent receptor [Lacinutrix sp. WUR7]
MVLFLLLGTSHFMSAQQVTGSVSDDSGPIPGASVIVKGTTNGTTTDFDGNYTIDANTGDVLIYSYVGYEEQEATVSGSVMNIVLQSGVSLDEVILVGNRAKPRSILDSPVPIDNIGVEELKNTGQPTVDKMLTYMVPSFNSTTQSISDGTAHFDPADLRGLGPSRTLVLVNGKRKNQSALVYINDTPGKGEVGVDLKSVPAAAIERIEVLRDGASAQYGSDAIAGVINMVLKKGVEFTTVSTKAGVTTEGDGFNFGADLNTSIGLGKEGSYLNFTLGYYQQEKTNRAGTPGKDDLFGVQADDATFGDWLAENSDLGMTIGQPEMKIMDVFVNAGVPIGNKGAEFYTFGGLTYRTGKSFALYRTPYWVTDPHNLLHEAGTEYQGFQPTFETDVRDNNMTAGFKWDLLGFKVDLSGTYGRNAVNYEVGNTLNIDLGANSPTSFDVGAYTFSNTLANLDLSKEIGKFVVSFGGEVRGERFTAKAGEWASYYNPSGSGGAQSFPGLQPSNAVSATRDNYGVYGALDWEPTEKLLIGGAVRYEDFSDFGDNTSWKVNGRYSLGEKGAIRASYGTGFRAPSLHQIYLSNVQTLVSGGSISNQGTFNNVDPIIRDGLGVPQLTAETSKNISAGITFKPVNNLSLSLDFYNVKVDNRVLFTNEIGFDDIASDTNPVEQILIDNSITSLKFFVNAVNTNTTGVDLVANYRNIELGSGKLGATLAANFNNTDIDGKIDTPALLEANGYDIFNRKEQARILSSRPKTKVLLGFDYELNKWNFALNNTYFGEVTWQHATDASKDQTFAGKVITDLIFGYAFSDRLSASLSVTNLLDVYPDEIETGGDVVTDLGGRFKYPWEVNQFGTNGTTISGGLNFKF